MLLQPQHLQQHDRYLQTQLEARVNTLRPYGWGFSRLRIDQQLLAQGKLSLLECSAVLPDGTPLALPLDDALPLPLDVPADARNVLVMLALPLRRPGVPEVAMAGHAGDEQFARHGSAEIESWDSNGGEASALLEIGKLRLKLALESEVANAYATLAVARIIERRADNMLVLDADFCPPCLDLHAAPKLESFAAEVVGLLHQRGDALAARLGQPEAAGAAEIADFLLLQLINRSEPLFAHLAVLAGLHPQQLYEAMLALAGELATFTQAGKRPAPYPPYRHTQLADSFQPLMLDLRKSLSAVMDSQAIAIPLEDRQFGIRVGVLPDPELLKSAAFVLAVHAQMPAEALRSGFPPQVKIGSVSQIGDMVNLQLPGIGLRPLPVAPRQLPFHAGYTYFELDRASAYWQQLNHSPAFALHVAGQFPGLHMQFWAIRK
ncbi:conserved hypothetical protein [Janthinobacterium agaricidamnosum NBRC 102515 = DSM 9628]|uniref:Type VI secretion protein, VC_A0114 family n=2 Tax=Janthinobacterium agaricidamnosum TaxID=55508 RepID=W0VEW2_9BURK|nr:conserved hypothetical protein [Janthinobacterium agaricidamnosum NBRC 102515 = DSM 9628]